MGVLLAGRDEEQGPQDEEEIWSGVVVVRKCAAAKTFKAGQIGQESDDPLMITPNRSSFGVIVRRPSKE